MYLNWQLWCALGLLVGGRIHEAQNWGLDFAMPVTFIGMTIPFVKNRACSELRVYSWSYLPTDRGYAL